MSVLAFNSVTFLLFLFFFFIIYYVVPNKIRWIVLLIASAIFYISAGMEKLPFIVLTAFIVFLSAGQINKLFEAAEQEADKKQLQGKERISFLMPVKQKCRNRYLIPTIILVIGILGYCKFGATFLRLIPKSIYDGAWADIIIPLGISYYTFSSIAYLLDIYWRKSKPITNYFKYLLCVSYFPQIVQGPIARYPKLSMEIFKEHSFNFKNICFGVQLMLYGYFKKLVIADRLAIFTTRVFDSITDYEGLTIAIALIFSSFQLYMDFSGCMDIVRGTSQIFDIELDKNFNHPFFSKSAAEFWRRWHITLGAWFKDYVYLPIVTSGWLTKITTTTKEKLGKEAARNLNTAIPLAIVWLLTGLWHGTGWNYIVWGIYWGILIISSTIFAKQYKKLAEFLHINTTTRGYQIFQMVRTFFLFTVGRMITALGTLENTALAAKQLFCCFNPWILWDGTLYQMGLDYKNLCVAILSLFIVRQISVLQEKSSVREMIASKNLILRWAIYYGLIFAILIFGIYGPGYNASDFVYTQF